MKSKKEEKYDEGEDENWDEEKVPYGKKQQKKNTKRSSHI